MDDLKKVNILEVFLFMFLIFLWSLFWYNYGYDVAKDKCKSDWQEPKYLRFIFESSSADTTSWIMVFPSKMDTFALRIPQ